MAFAEILNDTHIFVNTAWSEKELIKQVPGARWEPVSKEWRAPLSWATCVTLRGVFRDQLSVGDKLLEWAWARRVAVDEMMHMRVLTEPDWLWNPESGLYPFQRVGAEFLSRGGEVLLGDDMGTGKTIQALAGLLTLRQDALPALIICPNSVKTIWEAEARRWLPGVTSYVVTGGAVGRRQILGRAAADPSALIITNIEAVRLISRLAPFGSIRLKRCRECDSRGENIPASRCEVHPKELNAIPFRTVIIDEAHRIKDPHSKQTRAVWAVAHQPSVRYRWALTGTPIANTPLDLWSVLHAVSPKDFPTKTAFVDRYCLQAWNGYGGLDVVGINPERRAEFDAMFQPRFRRMPKDLVLPQLPAKVRSTRWVDMTPAQARAYKALSDGLGVIVGSGTLVAANDLVRRTRLMQYASASVDVDTHGTDDVTEWDVNLIEPSPKLDELEVILDELGPRQAVVCAEWRKLIDLAARRLDARHASYGLITGAVTSQYERQKTLEDFQAGRLQYLLFTIKAGGTGLTMTAADTLIRLQRSDSMVDNRQAEDRVHRIGSERHESVHIIDVVARDTIEVRQIASLNEKYARLQQIVQDRATIIAAGGDTTELDVEEARIMGETL
jgi:SNF2 family DNA or RNA helicase